jgi:hypothetical protein
MLDSIDEGVSSQLAGTPPERALSDSGRLQFENCPTNRSNNPELDGNIKIGATAGFTIAAIAGGLLVANVIGFPAVPAAEVAAIAAGGPSFLLILAGTESALAVWIGGASVGAYGAVSGGIVGYALTQPVSSAQCQ